MTSVLVVDDDESLCAAVARELAHRGFMTASAHCVDDALLLVSSAPPDVLLADLRMPGRDGIDLLQATSQISPRTRAILMSAFATARDYQTALSHGAIRVLSKPFTSDELVSAIGHAIECETGFRGDLHGLSLPDVLQMYHYARRSVTILLGGSQRGAVHLRHGEIVDAEAGALRGEPALRAILTRPSGSFSTRVLDDVRDSIERRFDGLLLDSLREIDEATHEARPESDGEFELFHDSCPPAADTLASAWVGAVRDAMARIAPEIDHAVIALAAGTVDPPELVFQPAWVGFARDIADALGRLSPTWDRYECLFLNHAIALIRGPDDLVMALSREMEGRYAHLKFRAVLGRLNSVVSMASRTNGGSNGKD